MGGEIALRFTDAELAREWEWLADRLRAAPIHGALSRSRYPSDVQVERELRFLLRTGDTMMEGSVDRVVVVIEEGVPVRAEVFDYKTDRIPSKRDTTSSPGENATWLDERLAFYSPQIEAYRESISAVLGIPHERVEAHLLFLDPGTLATVHPKLDR